jgi:hypothetical protein
MPVDLQIHYIIPDVGIDVDKKSSRYRDNEQAPVSTSKPDFPQRHHKTEKNGTPGKRNEPLDPQDTPENTRIDAITPMGATQALLGIE